MNQPDSQLLQKLLDELHQATQALHESKVRLERAMESSEFRHGERLAAAEEEFRKAERETEEVEQKIREALHSPARQEANKGN
jgi:hypothetical protein